MNGASLPFRFAWAWAVLYVSAGLIAVVAFSGLALATLLNGLNAAVFLHAGAWALMPRQDGTQVPLRWMSLSFLSFGLCQTYPVYMALRYQAIPDFPSVADWGALASLIWIGIGLKRWVPGQPWSGARLRQGVDGASAGIAVLFLGWVVAIQDMSLSSSVPTEAKLATYGFLLFNTIILTLAILVAAPRKRRFKGPLGWLALGMGLSILQVLIQVPLGLSGAYSMGHPVDLMVLASGACMVMAASTSATPEDGMQDPETAPILDTWAIVGPILPMACCLLVFGGVAWRSPHRLDRTSLLLGALLVGLTLLREFLSLRDYQRLSKELEDRVQQRSQALASAQGLLLRTERMNTMASLGAGMAHDLKNLVGVVKNYALLVNMDVQEGLAPQPKDLEAIQMAVDQAADMANRLMSFGRNDNRELTLFDLNTLADRLISLLRPTLPSPIALQCFPAPEPLLIIGDMAQVEQVLVNLVLNARDAISSRGFIHLRLHEEIAPHGDSWAVIQVVDSGCGMSPATQARAFEPFFTTKQEGSGTGLGLASVQHLVEQMEGRVSVESQVGKGSTFTIRFPMREKSLLPRA